jgi:chromosome partitioning protein
LDLQPRANKRSTQRFLDEVQIRQLMLAKKYRYPAKAQRISLMMCKGGVGKTTVSFYLAQRLAHYGARVLVIDTDPQGNLTAALCRTFGVNDITESTPVMMDVLSKRCSIHQAVRVLSPYLHMIPSTALNSLLDKKLTDTSVIPVFELHRQLSLVNHHYDYIVIDSAPALSLINASIMYASDRILLPLFMYEFSLMGLQQTLSEIFDLQQTFKFTVDVNVLVNKFNHRERLSFGYLGQLAQDHRQLILNSVIRASAQLQYSIATGKSLFGPRKSSGKNDFDSLAREIMDL